MLLCVALSSCDVVVLIVIALDLSFMLVDVYCVVFMCCLRVWHSYWFAWLFACFVLCLRFHFR